MAQCRGRLGVAPRRTRTMLGGQRFGAWSRGARWEGEQSGAEAWRLLREEEGMGFSFGLTARGYGAWGTGCMGCAQRPGGKWRMSEWRWRAVDSADTRWRVVDSTNALSERASGAVGLNGATVALGWAQFGAQCFSNYLKTALIL
jgi:hypothetical protein